MLARPGSQIQSLVRELDPRATAKSLHATAKRSCVPLLRPGAANSHTEWRTAGEDRAGMGGSPEATDPAARVHGIFQARILEWIAISFSRGSSGPRDQTCIFCIGRCILYYLATREAH